MWNKPIMPTLFFAFGLTRLYPRLVLDEEETHPRERSCVTVGSWAVLSRWENKLAISKQADLNRASKTVRWLLEIQGSESIKIS